MSNIGPFIPLLLISVGYILLAHLALSVFDRDAARRDSSDPG